MRVSVVILPVFGCAEGRLLWQRAEQLGFHAAYTYDHLSWRTFRDGPWHAAIPTLTAAATVTERIQLGTLVTSPNFRHPVTLAKDLMTIDDISGGRVTLGIGAGTTGFDASVLGGAPLTAGQRGERFAEFVTLLDQLLRHGSTTYEGAYFAAHEAAMHPGCVQRPRLPFAIAAGGPKGRALVATHGEAWVCTGHPDGAKAGREASVDFVRSQHQQVERAYESAGRDPGSLETIFLTGFTADRPFDSLDDFVDTAQRYSAAGVTELVLHWPLPRTMFDAPQEVLEEIAARGIGLVAEL